MWTSDTPASFAVVAAPIQKLCVVYSLSLTPAFLRVEDTIVAKCWRVKYEPSSSTNNGPSLAPQMAR